MRKRVDKRAAQANRRVLRAMGQRIKKRSRALTPFWACQEVVVGMRLVDS